MSFVFEHIFAITVTIIFIAMIALVVYNRNFIFKHFIKEPLTGGNGKTQMDELAKYLLTMSLLGMIAIQAFVSIFAIIEKIPIEQVFTETWFVTIASAVFAIAKVKIDLSKTKQSKDEESH